MGFFSFLKKKEPEISGFEPLKFDLSSPPTETIKPSPIAPHTPEVPSFDSFKMPEAAAPSFMQSKEPSASRDIELLSSKLDTIRVMLENLGHRLEKIEQQQMQQQAKDRARW